MSEADEAYRYVPITPQLLRRAQMLAFKQAQAAQERSANDRHEAFVAPCPGSMSPASPAHLVRVKTRVSERERATVFGVCEQAGCGTLVRAFTMDGLDLPERGGFFVPDAYAQTLLIALEALRREIYAMPPRTDCACAAGEALRAAGFKLMGAT